ncbi:MAG: hypothetical protein VW810_00145 [Pelagibacteraceae bacterium]
MSKKVDGYYFDGKKSWILYKDEDDNITMEREEKMDNETSFKTYLGGAGTIILLVILLFLVACTPSPKKLEFGKQCTPQGHWSYVWIKPSIGETDVNKENCNAKKR